jgi:hypothetical protein
MPHRPSAGTSVTIEYLRGTPEYEFFLQIAKKKGYQKAGFFKEIMNFWRKHNRDEVG